MEIRKYIGKGIDKFFYIKYDDSFTTFEISEFSDNGITFTYSYDEFAEWFISINSGQYLRHESKTIGSVRDVDIDGFVSSLLNEINQNESNQYDFSVDDNGLKLVKKVLNGQNIPTYGFDCDIFSSNTGKVIEFLKRENDHITNLRAQVSLE